MGKPKRNRQSGFSLIETMMAMLLLAVSLLALGQLIAVAVNQNALSRNNSVAITVAMGKLEQLRRLYNQQLAAGALTLATGSGVESMQGVGETSPGIGNYDVSWQVTALAGKEYMVKVTVQPSARNRFQSKSVEIVSHFAP